MSVNQEVVPTKVFSPYSLHTVCLLAPASIFGVLTRLGLLALTSYDGRSIFPLAYVQGVGCLIMGFLLRLKDPITDFYPPLYTALAAGYCGSVTTFSSWQLDVFESFINSPGFHRNALRNFIDGVGKTAITLALSLASVSFGADIATCLRPYLPTLPRPTLPVRYTVTVVAVLIYLATLPAYFLLPSSYRHQATAALLFAFPGALTRYYLSVQLNPRITTLPLGTLIANLSGTALLAAYYVIRNLKAHPISNTSCEILQGLSDGFCGCLTTISTFAVEVAALKGWAKQRYILLSWTTAQLLIVLIWGCALWTGTCGKYRTCLLND